HVRRGERRPELSCPPLHDGYAMVRGDNRHCSRSVVCDLRRNGVSHPYLCVLLFISDHQDRNSVGDRKTGSATATGNAAIGFCELAVTYGASQNGCECLLEHFFRIHARIPNSLATISVHDRQPRGHSAIDRRNIRRACDRRPLVMYARAAPRKAVALALRICLL